MNGGTPFPKGIGKPALRALSAAGYTHLEHLKGVTEASVLKLHGMGPKALGILRETLDARGLSFAAAETQKMRRCMIEQPQITQTDAVETAVIHVTVPRDQIREVMGPGYQELMAVIAEQGIGPAGPWYTHHLRMDPEVFDFEIGAPVTAPVTPAGRVEQGQLPAATVARTVYHGGFEGLPDAWGEFEAWIAAEGFAERPDLWEIYAAGPESSDNPADWRTELYRPLV